ncbi:MAG: glutamate formiminotransferase/formiminotetrahydrofolate cyclodeaminase [Saprospiraceae bacterium]|jgi:glutamate formiminotransferase/formiminotetrahydrofolate cyclodeaminase
MKQLIECVPNFSEGRDMSIIKQITDEIEKIDGVKLLDVDPGKATNRTVVTFVGEPKPVIEAAFQAIKKASELIDMSKHKGEHPRMGATDVCPLIPISNITLDETAEYARQLGERAGAELAIPFYLYEHAAAKKERQNLATVRSGEYEGLTDKLADPKWKPDYGPAKFNSKAGATAIGARDFLIAYNVNLNTTSVKRANSVAFDIREKGRIKREGDPINGKIVLDKKGEPTRTKGTCKSVKAIGWFIEEYGLAQISMNITNINHTSLHKAFEECRRSANKRGMRVTGSELVGLVPKKVMIAAGKYFLSQQNLSTGASDTAIIDCAVKSLGLNDLGHFDPKKKIIEYLLEEDSKKLIDMTLTAFADETASDSPAPGGGSISAYIGALGISLGTMVSNLSAGKRGWESHIDFFSKEAESGQMLKDKMLHLVDEDTAAFNKIIDAVRMPKATETEKKARTKAMDEATKYAINIPMEIMRTSLASYDFLKTMAQKGNPNSVSDAGVGALACRTAVHGAYLNVKINCADFQDEKFVAKTLKEADKMLAKSDKNCENIIKIVDKIIG